jgi:hypothetical protein
MNHLHAVSADVEHSLSQQSSRLVRTHRRLGTPLYPELTVLYAHGHPSAHCVTSTVTSATGRNTADFHHTCLVRTHRRPSTPSSRHTVVSAHRRAGAPSCPDHTMLYAHGHPTAHRVTSTVTSATGQNTADFHHTCLVRAHRRPSTPSSRHTVVSRTHCTNIDPGGLRPECTLPNWDVGRDHRTQHRSGPLALSSRSPAQHRPHTC